MSGIEAIASFMPIHLHLQKLCSRFYLRAHSLPLNHIIRLILETRLSDNIKSHTLSLERLISRQQAIIKSPIIDMNNRFNEVFSSFSPFNYKISPWNRLIDIFPNHFSFHTLNRNSDNNIKSHLLKLNNLTLQASSDPRLVVVVIDASIKNQVATLISHVHSHDRLVIKIVHHTVNITTTEAKLFAIRCRINQAIHLPNVSKIFIITDSIHMARKIFDLISHLYQAQSAAIFRELREFFKKASSNFINFLDCPSNCKWLLHNIVNEKTKEFNLSLVFLYKLLWDFSKKCEYDSILNNWKMFFQASDAKGHNFWNF